MRRFVRPGIAALLASGVLACTTALLATPAGETKLGSAEAADVEKEIGLVAAPALEKYVAEIGQRLSQDASVRTGITYRFQIVDMVAPNAFALPGGFIYVSRGLLALLNSEDELASVIAHEIGHVSARHHLRHALLETPLLPVRLAAGIGSVATGIVSPGLGYVVGAIGSAPGSLTLASHSRGQEDEADAIGQGLVARAGWDPKAMATVMDALTREAELEGHDPNARSFLDTHPTTPSRSKRTLERAASLKVARRAPFVPDRRHFYEMLDGLLYGDSAAHGVVFDNEFLHPELDVRVAFPEGWQIANAQDSVLAAPERGDALAVLSIAAEGGDPFEVAKRVVARSAVRIDGPIEATKLNGLPAARVSGRTRAGWFSYYRDLAVWVAQGRYVYQISGTTREADWPRYRDALGELVASFRGLERRDHAHVREARLRVVDAHPREALAHLLVRVHSAWTPERAAASNGLAPDDALSAGRPLKVARWEIYRDDGEEH
jgi:predicted Zn-dependent protease